MRAIARAEKRNKDTDVSSSLPNSSAATPTPDTEQKLLPSPETSTLQHSTTSGAFSLSAVCPICLETKLDLGQTGTPTYRQVQVCLRKG